MKSEGLDIRFFEEINRRMATGYAALLVLSVFVGAACAFAARQMMGRGVVVPLLSGFAGWVIALAFLRPGLVARRAETLRTELLEHARETGDDRAAAVAFARANDFPFVADLLTRLQPASDPPTIDAPEPKRNEQELP